MISSVVKRCQVEWQVFSFELRSAAHSSLLPSSIVVALFASSMRSLAVAIFFSVSAGQLEET